jgi:flavin-dependent dehydrogenase
MKHVDVAIIGGSLAGAACVRELTRFGIDAVAFERDRFPREKVCGGFLSPGAIDLLDQLGTLEAVRAAGAMTVRSSRVRMGNFEACVPLPREGLGISRSTLDSLIANHPGVQHGSVRGVQRTGNTFRVQLEEGEISARVVVDAAGKLSRFTTRKTSPEFGVQFYESGSHGDILDFWFFENGYGGAVSVEGDRSNSCFLIYKDVLPGYLRSGFENSNGKKKILVTGPLSYKKLDSDFLSVGDAAGMVDPFCGEGMRHALETGMFAATVVAEGLRSGKSYDTMRASYGQESQRLWSRKRRLGRLFRAMLKHPRLSAAGFRLNPEYWLRKLWD